MGRRRIERPPVEVETHYGNRGDTLYAADIVIEGREMRAVYVARWQKPEYVGLFRRHPTMPDAFIYLPRNERGMFGRHRDYVRSAVVRESWKHPWLQFVARTSPCEFGPGAIQCRSEKHGLWLPSGFQFQAPPNDEDAPPAPDSSPTSDRYVDYDPWYFR